MIGIAYGPAPTIPGVYVLALVILVSYKNETVKNMASLSTTFSHLSNGLKTSVKQKT